MRTPLAHPFYNLEPPRDWSRSSELFEVQQSLSFQQLMEALRLHGFALGWDRINHPPVEQRDDDEIPLSHVDTSDFLPGDAAVTFVRLPVSDKEQEFRRRVHEARTDLERELTDLWAEWIPILSGGHARIHPELRWLLPPGKENRYDMTFYQDAGARYKELRTYTGKFQKMNASSEPRTAAFLLRVPRLPKRDIGYIGACTIDEISMLVLSHLLRHRHADLLAETGLTMIELVGAPIPTFTTDYRWTLEWRAEVLFRVPLDFLSGTSPATGAVQRAPGAMA
ncbi:MAG: hypothetical protein E4H11_03445 [Myxococcales bacterium]|nr:MAG: hypothetical protein E4H11_03445 [Myxococcales bacterium]